ncbi:PREDICTED: midkine-like isoform X2 [Elephantulus edwardii]|uniref:midkine-like isoform X2 n=1 Tax=Elephantulus edwardii TaxID=28737 RepID=UPI0003F0A978|nr:PREDICTED: midkine-like isoform X2 [Elephantulus edwardii]
MQHRAFLLALLTLLALTSVAAKKKDKFGADCKYKFESWGACDGDTGTKARQGTLKKVWYNAQCQETILMMKPCTPKAKAKKGKGKD